ncbi:MAG: hypothetical protein DWQ09_15120 [Proteobacteria bacterium]|nr:MAG: hypothetical protein DWQ09_15120 [Pseudomonadota bacterium]
MRQKRPGIRQTVLLALVDCATSTIACSNRRLYGGFKAGSRNECLKLPASQQQECMDRYGVGYDQYWREKEKLESGAG